MPTAMPVMPVVFLALLLLPVRLGSFQLKALAFFLWLMGGIILSWLGLSRLFQGETGADSATLLLIAMAALVIGVAKGKFVLSKTSKRNIERLNDMAEPHRPIHVYSSRSWMMIAVMVGISVLLNALDVPMLWRGGINLAIGFALVSSSLAYLKALKPTSV